MANIPFPPEHELNKQLDFDHATSSLGSPSRKYENTNLPGQPRVALKDTVRLNEYLSEEHSTPKLDTLAPKLWLVSTPRYWHISPLHHQAVRGRKIILTESPNLHLVWYYDRIFIKPLPPYLLSHAFWEYLGTQPLELRRAITGLMRTYAYLIRYETDFRLATSAEQQLFLIPTHDGSGRTDGSEKITFERLITFISMFENLPDEHVSPRYGYGELRLTRLNVCAKIFLGKLTYHHIDAQWSSYLGRFLAPLLSIFAIISVALNAMQVELGAQGLLQGSQMRWTFLAYVSRWFSCVTLIITASIAVFVSFFIGWMLLHDVWFARSVLRQRREAPSMVSSDFRSGIV